MVNTKEVATTANHGKVAAINEPKRDRNTRKKEIFREKRLDLRFERKSD